MNKLNIDKFNHDKNTILNIPDHLVKLANSYKEDYLKKQKDNRTTNLETINNQASNLNSLVRIKEELVDDTNCIIINEKVNIHHEDDYSNSTELSIKKEQFDQQHTMKNDDININENSTNRSLSPPASSIVSASTSNQANNLVNKSISTSDSSSETSTSESSSSSTSSTSSSSETDTSDESDDDDTSTSDSDDDSDTSTSSSSTGENVTHNNDAKEMIIQNDSNNSKNTELDNDEPIEGTENNTNYNNTSNNND
jgi:hypothetical protein